MTILRVIRSEENSEGVRPLPFGLAAVIFMAQMALGIVLFAIFQEFVPNQLGTGDAWGGFLLTAYGATRFFLETPTGAILDRIQRRYGLLIGLTLMVPSIVLMHFVREEYAYLAFASGLGLGTAFLWPASYSISADLYPPERRGRVVGLLNVGQLLGFGLGALIGALVVESSPGALFITASAAIGLALVGAAIATPTYTHIRELLEGRRPSIRDVMSLPLASMCLVILLISTGMGLMIPAIRPFGEDVLETSFRTLTIALIPAIVIAGATYLPAGLIADRTGRLIPLFIGQCMSAAALISVSFSGTLVVAAALAVPGFAGYALSVPAWNATVMDLAPESHRGAIIGFSVALTGFGLGIGPLVGGLILQWVNPEATFFASGLTFALAAATIAIYGLRVDRGVRAAPAA